MADHKSAKKRAIQNDVRRLRNKGYLSQVKTAVKSVREAAVRLKDGKETKEVVQKLLTLAQSLLHKAATKGMIHRNNASRKVSRLAKAVFPAPK